MLDIALHSFIAFVAFVAALFVEHYRIALLSRLLFWKRRDDLMGTYTTTWVVDQPPPLAGADGKVMANQQEADLARLKWASGSYVSGTATNATYGDYSFNGRTEGDGISLTYRSNEKSLRAHLGVIVLRKESDGVYKGYWIQHRPDKSAIHVGTTVWKKRTA